MWNRREWLATTGLAAGSATTAQLWQATHSIAAEASDSQPTRGLHLSTFRIDVTPPIGHSCCGGWIRPVETVDDALEAIGMVLLGAGQPIVLCAVDWTGLLNEAHIRWREALAEAVGTTADRVAVQSVHQHNAPFACLRAERIVAAQGDLPHIVDVGFFEACLDRLRTAASVSIERAEPITHIATGQAKVDRVASNRRVSRDTNGDVASMRGSSCKDEQLRGLPEGLIDPWLKTVAFYRDNRKLAACHYYATHPMSFYADGRVSSDFVGLARKRRQDEEPDCTHLYFTGCAGNIAAGKYNDGSPAARRDLTDRLYDGIVRSEADLQPQQIDEITWRTVDMLPPSDERWSADAIARQIDDSTQRVVARNRPAYTLAWLERCAAAMPIVLSSLRMGDTTLLHLPAECFVQYQLRAQEIGGDHQFVATAAYGDGGPWYIPIAAEYDHGGYEVSVAFCDRKVDSILDRAMRQLLLS